MDTLVLDVFPLVSKTKGPGTFNAGNIISAFSRFSPFRKDAGAEMTLLDILLISAAGNVQNDMLI